jgi:tubulin polyglutamylase TTLL4
MPSIDVLPADDVDGVVVDGVVDPALTPRPEKPATATKSKPKKPGKHRCMWTKALYPMHTSMTPYTFGTRNAWFDYPPFIGRLRDAGDHAGTQTRDEAAETTTTLRFKVSEDVWEYNSVCNAFKRAGFARSFNDAWNVRWGKPLCSDDLRALKWFQRVNHFPGAGLLGRKDRMASNIQRSARTWPDEFNFIPRTYELPSQRALFEVKFKEAPTGTLWIVKPVASSCGRGIRVVSQLSEIREKKTCIVSRYIANPHLIDGRKYDLRVYVLVTCYDPLRVSNH